MTGDSVFAAAIEGTPLDHLALETRGASVTGPRETVTIRDSSWQAPNPGPSTGSRLITPGLSKEEAHVLRQEPQLERALRGGHLRASEGLWEEGCGCNL